MRFLPIVERELRVASHQPKTWIRRVSTTGVALAVLGFAYLTLTQWRTLSTIGVELFGVLSGFGMVYVVLAGPLATVDCLSHERREGTLGLLFLTDLKGYDVVLGKVFAASLNTALDLTAALPVVAIPILIGGVSLRQFGVVIVALVTTMFLSLAIGVWASSLFNSARSSLASTLAVLFLLTLALPFLGEEAFGVQSRSAEGPFLYMFSPLYAMQDRLGGVRSRMPAWSFWLNIGAMSGLAWACLAGACRRTATSWRDLPVSGRLRRWRGRFEHWRQGSSNARRAWRRRMLSRDPVNWLEGRDRLQERMLWGMIIVSVIVWAGAHLTFPAKYPSEDWVALWPALTQYLLCVWIGNQAPRRLGDDKQSGALELLLCTPIKPREIVGGTMRSLCLRFGRALAAMFALDAFLAVAWFSEHGGWQAFYEHDFFPLAIFAGIVFPVQAHCLAKIGVYEGLVRANSVRATFMTLVKAGVLPWVMFIGTMITWSIARKHISGLPDITDLRVYGVWAVAHLLPCLFFLAHASWWLNAHLRSLAAQPASLPWWKRWLNAEL